MIWQVSRRLPTSYKQKGKSLSYKIRSTLLYLCRHLRIQMPFSCRHKAICSMIPHLLCHYKKETNLKRVVILLVYQYYYYLLLKSSFKTPHTNTLYSNCIIMYFCLLVDCWVCMRVCTGGSVIVNYSYVSKLTQLSLF